MKIQISNKKEMKGHTAGMVSILCLVLFFIISCEKTQDHKYSPPSDHSISKDGFMHKSGLEQPLTNCVNCHGSDLEGGTVEVSCFECHGKKW